MPSAGGQSPHGVPGWRRCSRHTLGLPLLDTLTSACVSPTQEGSMHTGGGGAALLLCLGPGGAPIVPHWPGCP